MTDPVFKSNLLRGEVLTAEVKTPADLYPASLKLSIENDSLAKLLNSPDPYRLTELEAARFAEKSIFDPRVQIDSKLGRISWDGQQFSGALILPDVDLAIRGKDDILDLSLSTTVRPRGVADEIKINSDFKYDHLRGNLTAGEFSLHHPNFESGAYFKEGQFGGQIMIKDPAQDFSCLISYEDGRGKTVSISVEQRGRSLALTLTPEGEILEARGKFKLGEGWDLGVGAEISERELRHLTEINYSSPHLGRVSLKLEAGMEAGQKLDMSALLQLELTNLIRLPGR